MKHLCELPTSFQHCNMFECNVSVILCFFLVARIFTRQCTKYIVQNKSMLLTLLHTFSQHVLASIAVITWLFILVQFEAHLLCQLKWNATQGHANLFLASPLSNFYPGPLFAWDWWYASYLTSVSTVAQRLASCGHFWSNPLTYAKSAHGRNL